MLVLDNPECKLQLLVVMLGTVAVEEAENIIQALLVVLMAVVLVVVVPQAVVLQTLAVEEAEVAEMATTKLGLEVLVEVLE